MAGHQGRIRYTGGQKYYRHGAIAQNLRAGVETLPDRTTPPARQLASILSDPLLSARNPRRDAEGGAGTTGIVPGGWQVETYGRQLCGSNMGQTISQQIAVYFYGD
jgi:hypothetical protein